MFRSGLFAARSFRATSRSSLTSCTAGIAIELITLELHTFTMPESPIEEDVDWAVDLAFRNRVAEWRFRPVVLLVHGARHGLLAGDYDQAVIALTTAVELLTKTAVAAALYARGEGHRVAGVIECGLTNLLRDHLEPLLSQLGADPQVATRWAEDCYKLRKHVAHEGLKANGVQGKRALDATLELGTALRSSPSLTEFGDQLPFGT
jgi:hypothetical protein